MHSISKLNKFIISSSAWFGGVFFYPGAAIIKAVLRLCEKNYKKMKKSVDKHKRLVYYIYCSRHTWAAKLKRICGEVSEWFKELVLKTSDSERGRGFESHPLRHFYHFFQWEPCGEVPKWLKGLPWKGSRPLIAVRGFKSHLLRQKNR